MKHSVALIFKFIYIYYINVIIKKYSSKDKSIYVYVLI